MRGLPVTLLALASLVLAGCVGPSAPSFDEAPPSAEPTASTPVVAAPYAGQQAREIKALAPEDIAGYRKGAGLGYAKPAELNSYPGPLHALDMAAMLELTEEQVRTLQAQREKMLANAMPLGERYLFVEGEIEQAFRDGAISPERLKALLDESAAIEAQLRYVHLATHIDTRAVLTQHQIALYDQARGYGGADHTSHQHG